MKRQTTFNVRCRVRGHNTSGLVHDLSRASCLLESGNGFIVAGDYVMLRFDNGVQVRGRATLLHGRIARVEFEQPLHEAVHAHLVGESAAPARTAKRHFTHSHPTIKAARRLA